MSRYDNNSSYSITFNVSEALEWELQHKNISNEVESRLLQKHTIGLMKMCIVI